MENLAVLAQGLDPILIQKAREELGETPEVQEKALIELRKLINDDPDFYCTEDDSFLLRFLRSKKYKVKEAFRTLQNFYELRVKHPAGVSDKIKSALDQGHILIPPKRTPKGDIVMIINSGRMDLENFTPEDYYQAGVMCIDTIIDSDANQICRSHLIVDLKDMTMKKLKQYTSPSFLAMLSRSFENCTPVRLGSLSIVNAPFYFTLPYKIIYHMLTEKSRNRIRLLGSDMSELYKTFPPHMLPETLGGTMSRQTLMEFKNTMIHKHLEIERVSKYSFLRQSKPVKKHSTCGLEENNNFLQNNTSSTFHQSEVTN